jgi:biopolymer transport protein ExbD
MARRKHYRRHDKDVPELEITTFLNLMVILVPFLLINAVFSRINILELDLPVSSGSAAANQPKMSIEVMVRAESLQVGDGRVILTTIPKEDHKYNLKKLSEFLLELKAKVPDKTDATVLMEPDIEYDNLVHVMDAVRVAEIRQTGTLDIQKIALFPDISIGDAP